MKNSGRNIGIQCTRVQSLKRLLLCFQVIINCDYMIKIFWRSVNLETCTIPIPKTACVLPFSYSLLKRTANIAPILLIFALESSFWLFFCFPSCKRICLSGDHMCCFEKVNLSMISHWPSNCLRKQMRWSYTPTMHISLVHLRSDKGHKSIDTDLFLISKV